MAEADLNRPAFRYSSAGRRPERLNQSRNVNAPLQLARGWAAGLLGLPGDIEGLVRLLPGLDETPRLPTSDFYREYLPGYDPRPAARAMSGLGALTGGAGATGVVRGGLGAVKRATDLNAIRDYVRSAQGLSGLPGTAVVKPKGGNWLKGPGSPEDTVQALKVRDRFGMTDPTELSAALGIPLEEAQALQASNAPNAAINQWLDQKLAKYIRNEMGTPEDPLRALVLERGVSHVPLETLQEGAGWIPDEVALARKRAGFPEIGMVEEGSGQMYGDLSELQRAASGWETAADMSIRGERAGDLMRLGEGSPTVRANPWLAKVPPETPVYSFKGFGEADLGFSHLVDELRNAVREGSDLPRELQLRPEQLSKVSMPQAVELVDRINKWRAAQKAEADLARSTNVATQTFKEYPEQGYRWVEIRTPELPEGFTIEKDVIGVERLRGPGVDTLPGNLSDPRRGALEDALQYEADVMGHCVGRYCPDIMEGRSRIFSLRDAKGQPHVTVEVRPPNKAMMPYDYWYDRVGKDSPEVKEFLAWAQERKPARGDLGSMYEQWAKETGRPVEVPPSDIVQIKGKGNRAPKDEYLPYVQDFVKSQRWGRVGDLGNTGLVDISTYPDAPEYLRRGPRFISQQEYDDAVRRAIEEQKRTGNEPGFARGGMVSAGPAQYDPAHISALVEELLMEA